MNQFTVDEKMLSWRALMELHASVVEALERHLQEGGVGVPLAWYEVLLRLWHAPGSSMRMQDLADVLLLSRSGVTRLADRLESAGFIERRVCETDRRGTLAVITDAGREALDRCNPLVVEALDEHFSRYLTKADAHALMSILQRVLAAERHVHDAATTQAAASELVR